MLKKNFREEYSAIPYGENFITAEDLTTRSGTSSNIVIQGVKKGENPELATMWTHIGFPNTCLALPAWVKGGDNLPSVLVKGKNNNHQNGRIHKNIHHNTVKKGKVSRFTLWGHGLISFSCGREWLLFQWQ